MARKINNIAEVKVFINGRAQAEKELDALRQKAKLYADQMEMANNIMLANADDPTKFKEYNSAKKDFELYRSELKKTDKAIKETEKLQVDLAEALNHLSDQNITRLKSLQRQLEAVRNKVEGTEDPDNDFLRYLNESIKKVSDTIKNKKGDLVEFENIIKNLGKASPKELEMVKNRLQDLIRVTELGTSELKTYEDQLRQITEEEKLRKAVAAEQVMSNLKGNSVEQIREAVHATEQLRDAHQRGSDDWEKYNKQIDDANNFLKSYETESKKAAALKVADNLDIASTSEMKESVEFLTRYRDTLSSTDDEYKDIQAAIDRTSESLKNFNGKTIRKAK